MTVKKEHGEVDLEIGRRGIRVHFTNTPKWAYILIAIGLMFLLTFIGHAVFSHYRHVESVDKMIDKIAEDQPLSDEDIEFIKGLTISETKRMKKEVNRKIKIEDGGMTIEQNVAPGTKTTITHDGKKTSITKGGD